MMDLIDMKIIAEIDFSRHITQILTASLSSMLFIGLTTQKKMEGIIRSFHMQENSLKKFKDLQCHSKPITSINLSKDQTFLFTASEDGSLCILRQQRSKKSHDNEHYFHYSDEVTVANYFEEVLISKATLKEKSSQNEMLRRRVRSYSIHIAIKLNFRIFLDARYQLNKRKRYRRKEKEPRRVDQHHE